MTHLDIHDSPEGRFVVLPPDVLTHLQVADGDRLYALATPDGVELRRYDADFVRQYEAAQRVIEMDHEALRGLAE